MSWSRMDAILHRNLSFKYDINGDNILAWRAVSIVLVWIINDARVKLNEIQRQKMYQPVYTEVQRW